MRFLYRKHLALKLLQKIAPTPDSALEIGFSTRDILSHTAIRNKMGIDLREEACQKAPFTAFHVDEKDFVPAQPVDLVVVLEVLEHIADDSSALHRWKSWLTPSGHMLISVPAKMKLWDENDIFSKHLRRYEKIEFKKMLADTGFEIITFYSYGFPFYNLIKRIGNLVMKSKMKKSAGPTKKVTNPENNAGSINPGTMSGIKFLAGKVIANRLTFAFHDLFLGTDLGIGYMALCRLKIPSPEKIIVRKT